MAISETSNAPSRTMGLKPLLVGEYAMKSNSTKSDLTVPFFSATVPGWSPSSVRSRIAISIFRFVDIDEPGFRQRLAHVVHVEAELAFGELLALALLVGGALFALGHDVGGVLAADHDNAILIGDHGIAGHHVDAGADYGNVDRAQCRLHRALGRNRLRPNGKAHFTKRFSVAHAGIDDQTSDTARHQRGRQEIAEHPVGIVGGTADHQDIARLA